MNRIRLLREEVDMTQKELATRLGVKGGAVISKYESESNSLSAETLRSLSIIFGVSVDYILGLSDDRKKGTSFARPQMAWDALALVDGADMLSIDDRKLLFDCVKNPKLLNIVRKYQGLSGRDQKKADEYVDMLKVVEDTNSLNDSSQFKQNK